MIPGAVTEYLKAVFALVAAGAVSAIVSAIIIAILKVDHVALLSR